MNLATLFVVPLALVAVFSTAEAQTLQVKPANPPELKLELIPLKTTYKVGEPLVVQYRLTSLVDGTLCFPPPSTSAQEGDTGYLQTDLKGPIGNVDLFIENYWPVHQHEGQLRDSVLNRWVRLGMSEPYQSKKALILIRLDEPGEWSLRAAYSPPVLTPGDKEVVKSMGCTPPGSSVNAEPVTITVVNSSLRTSGF